MDTSLLYASKQTFMLPE